MQRIIQEFLEISVMAFLFKDVTLESMVRNVNIAVAVEGVVTLKLVNVVSIVT
jgi:hypothetical protein